MTLTHINLRRERTEAVVGMKRFAEIAKTRSLSPDEEKQFEDLVRQVDALDKRLLVLENGERNDLEEGEDGGERSVRSRGRKSDLSFGDIANDKFSIGRAIRSILENGKVTGYEAEISQEIAHRSGRSPRADGFFVPTMQTRDTVLNTTTGVGAVATNYFPDPIEILRSKTIVGQLGATILPGLSGIVRIPRQTQTITAEWVSEGGAPSSVTSAAFDYVQLTPRQLTGVTAYSRQFLASNALGDNLDKFLRMDMTKSVAVSMDQAALFGDGSGANPTGVISTLGVPMLESNTLSWDSITDLEKTVLGANAMIDPATTGYACSPHVVKKLKTITKLPGTSPYPVFLLNDQDKTLNGYNYQSSTVIKDNINVSGVGNTSAVFFGDFSQLLIGTWLEASEILVDPFSLGASSMVRLLVYNTADLGVRHPASFAFQLVS